MATARAPDRPAAGSARGLLLELQVEQHHHDEMYHREIARLPLHQRLNHLALHFAKYAGRIAQASKLADALPVFVDSLIIAISAANVLNLDMWELLDQDDREFPGLLAFGRAIAASYPVPVNDRDELLRRIVIAAGRMAAACEKIDHLEEISFRSEMKAGIKDLTAYSLGILASQGADPQLVVHARLQGVKSRLKLHGRI